MWLTKCSLNSSGFLLKPEGEEPSEEGSPHGLLLPFIPPAMSSWHGEPCLSSA